MSQKRQSVSPIAGIIAFVFVAIMIWIALSAVRGVFMILSWLALPLIVIALILNYRVVTDYIQWLWQTIKKDAVKGILYTLGSAVGYPFVSAYLAFKAYMSRGKKGSRKKEKAKGDYIKYEEVEEDDFLELPEIPKREQAPAEKPTDNKYDDMF